MAAPTFTCGMVGIILMLVVTCCQGTADVGIVEVVSNIDNVTRPLFECSNRPALFGPDLNDTGLWGYLMAIDPDDACDRIKRPPTNGTQRWFALIHRYPCHFDKKVFNAQNAGYSAAIVYNNDSDDTIHMSGGPDSYNITIPSVFIGYHSAMLLQQYSNRTNVFIVIRTMSSSFPATMYFILMGCFGFLGIVIGICIVFINWACHRAKRRKSLMSKSKLKKLPVHHFKTGDLYESCAICLEEYVEGDKLRILPCAHAYHCKCVDPWLTEKKNTCPLCKDVVTNSRYSGGTKNSANDETRRLLDDDDEQQQRVVDDGDHVPAAAEEVQRTGTSINDTETVAEVHVQPATSRRHGYGTINASGPPRISSGDNGSSRGAGDASFPC